MTEPMLIATGYVIGAVIAYELLRWLMVAATHRFRLEAGCDADRWAGDSRVDRSVRSVLAALADTAYRPAAPWRMLLLLNVSLLSMIAGVIAGMIRAIFSRLPPPDPAGIADDVEVAAQVVRLKLRLIAALISTSPLASILATAVLAVGWMIGFALLRSGRAIALYIAAAGDGFMPRAAYPRAA